MSKALNLMLFTGLILVLTFGIISANTLVGGKIYNSDYSNVIEGADVGVQCGSDYLTTTSLPDGTYAISFDTASCYSSGVVQVTASKSNLYGEGSAVINHSAEGDVAVANLNIKTKTTTITTSSHSKGSGGYYLCGNKVCDSGETSQTCLSDCPIVSGSNETATLNNSENTGLNTSENQSTENASNNPGITGAVTGTSGNKNLIIIIIAGILFLVIAIFVINLIRKRKKQDKFLLKA
jgi:hypothetical protein